MQKVMCFYSCQGILRYMLEYLWRLQWYKRHEDRSRLIRSARVLELDVPNSQLLLLPNFQNLIIVKGISLAKGILYNIILITWVPRGQLRTTKKKNITIYMTLLCVIAVIDLFLEAPHEEMKMRSHRRRLKQFLRVNLKMLAHKLRFPGSSIIKKELEIDNLTD